MKNTTEIKSSYHIQVVDIGTNEVRQELTFGNVITQLWKNSLRNLPEASTMPNGMCLGIGTGVPATTDSDLFDRLSAHYCSSISNKIVGYPHSSRVYQAVINASEAVGVLTEMGLCYTQSNAFRSLFSHALFTDSEGNPITIHKTDTDILYITVTVDFTFSMPEAENFWPVKDISNALVVSALSLAEGYDPGIYLLPYAIDPQIPLDPIRQAAYQFAPSAGSRVMNAGQLTANISLPYNVRPTYGISGFEVKAIFLAGLGVFNVTTDIFSPYHFPKYQVGVGDGSCTDFYIKTPSAIEGTQKVYVDGILKTEGVDYTFYGINAKDFVTNLCGANARYASSDGGYLGSSYERPIPCYPFACVIPNTTDPESWASGDYSGIHISNSTPLYFDFGVPMEVNAINFASLGGFQNISLEYSVDKTTWTTAYSIDNAATAGILNFAAITARYWRWVATSTTTSNLNTRVSNTNAIDNIFLFAFGLIKPNITFTVAPNTGVVIEVEYDSQYPFHNNLHTVQAAISGSIVY